MSANQTNASKYLMGFHKANTRIVIRFPQNSNSRVSDHSRFATLQLCFPLYSSDFRVLQWLSW